MRIIDTHLHLVERGRFRYPWLEGIPALNRDWSLEAYRSEAEQAGIEMAVHVEVDVADDDRAGETDWVTGLPAPVGGAIASCRPEAADFPVQLDRIVANPAVRGLRRILHTSPDELGLHPLFTDNLRRLGPHRLTFDLCVLARQLPIATVLAKACPDVQFVLDHCGVPNVRNRALDPWRVDIAALGELPNVACKLSGLVAYADPRGWSVDDLRPFAEHAIAVFGWDRVVWGSDWPVCTLTADLTRWVAATHTLLAGTSQHEKTKLLCSNAGRIYRLA
jgi:predicted TIM-barrel fold metal-dependent hydrolase